jgi:hypothetical protein
MQEASWTPTSSEFPTRDLRFVDADQVVAITAAYIRCDLDRSDVGQLAKPQGAPAYYANAIEAAQPVTMRYMTGQYGTMFGRAHWTQRR